MALLIYIFAQWFSIWYINKSQLFAFQPNPVHFNCTTPSIYYPMEYRRWCDGTYHIIFAGSCVKIFTSRWHLTGELSNYLTSSSFFWQDHEKMSYCILWNGSQFTILQTYMTIRWERYIKYHQRITTEHIVCNFWSSHKAIEITDLWFWTYMGVFKFWDVDIGLCPNITTRRATRFESQLPLWL